MKVNMEGRFFERIDWRDHAQLQALQDRRLHRVAAVVVGGERRDIGQVAAAIGPRVVIIVSAGGSMDVKVAPAVKVSLL